MLNNTLVNDLQVTCDNYMSALLDLYQCKDWGVNLVRFLEIATEITLETIGNWQSEPVDEEE